MKKKVKIMNKNQRIVKLTLKIIKKHLKKIKYPKETKENLMKVKKHKKLL